MRPVLTGIGMRSAVMEPDPSGTFVGSSYTFATPRDWARFGLLYLRDGIWQGERILPEGWVECSCTPTPKAPQGQYGAHFWLNAGTALDPMDRRWPRIPKDAFWAEALPGDETPVFDQRMSPAAPHSSGWRAIGVGFTQTKGLNKKAPFTMVSCFFVIQNSCPSKELLFIGYSFQTNSSRHCNQCPDQICLFVP